MSEVKVLVSGIRLDLDVVTGMESDLVETYLISSFFYRFCYGLDPSRFWIPAEGSPEQ